MEKLAKDPNYVTKICKNVDCQDVIDEILLNITPEDLQTITEDYYTVINRNTDYITTRFRKGRYVMINKIKYEIIELLLK